MIKYVIIFCMSCFVTHAYGQTIERSVIASAGNTFTNSSLAIDWTIGETAIATSTSTNTILTQGFHQSSSNATSISSINIEGLMCFPNPTNDIFNFQYSNAATNAVVTLLDQNGRLVKEEKWNTSNTMVWDLSNLAAGVYHAQISINNLQTVVNICKI